MGALLVLVLIKTAADYRAHKAERLKFGAVPREVAPVVDKVPARE
jgi:hypothetical protein